MERIAQPLDHFHSFFSDVYCEKEHKSFYYGLSSKEPCVPLLFQCLGTNPICIRDQEVAGNESEEEKRLYDLKSILRSFVMSNIQMISSRKFQCQIDNHTFPCFKDSLLHMREHHRLDFEQLLRVLLYDYEQDHLSFFFTKLFYTNVLYPPVPVGQIHPSINQEYPSVLSPSFKKNTQPIESISHNRIAMLTQQKLKALGLGKPNSPIKRNSPKQRVQSAAHQQAATFTQIFTTKDLYELDLLLFPTAIRSKDGLASCLLKNISNGPPTPKAPQEPSKNSKRKRKKKNEIAPNTEKKVKPVVPSNIPDNKKSKVVVEAEDLEKKKKFQEMEKKKKQDAELQRVRAKEEKERKEKERREKQEAAKQKKEEERQRKVQDQKRKEEEKKRQMALKKEVDILFAQYGESMAAELIEEVVCDLCGKLARRSLQEAKKIREKREEEMKREAEKQRQIEAKRLKKEERESRRHFRNMETERLWNVISSEVVQMETSFMVQEIFQEFQQEMEEQERRAYAQQRHLEHEQHLYNMQNEEYVKMQHAKVQQLYQAQHNMTPQPFLPANQMSGHSTPVYSNGNYSAPHHSLQTSFQSPIDSPGAFPPLSHPSERHTRHPEPRRDNEPSEMESSSTDVFGLHSELKQLIGEDFTAAPASTTSTQPPPQTSFSFSSPFSVFGEQELASHPSSLFKANMPGPIGGGLGSKGSRHGNGYGTTSNTHFPISLQRVEESGLIPSLTAIIYNLPNTRKDDFFQLFGLAFSQAQYSKFLLRVWTDERCCLVQVENENDLNRLLQLDGSLIGGNPTAVHIIPAQTQNQPQRGAMFDSYSSFDLHGRNPSNTAAPFDVSLPYTNPALFQSKSRPPTSFHVEPFVSNQNANFRSDTSSAFHAPSSSDFPPFSPSPGTVPSSSNNAPPFIPFGANAFGNSNSSNFYQSGAVSNPLPAIGNPYPSNVSTKTNPVSNDTAGFYNPNPWTKQ